MQLLAWNQTFCFWISGSRAMSWGKNFSKVGLSMRSITSEWYWSDESPPIRNRIEAVLKRSNSTDLPPINDMIIDKSFWFRPAKFEGSWYLAGPEGLKPGGGAVFLAPAPDDWKPGGGAPLAAVGAGAGWAAGLPFHIVDEATFLTGTKLALILLELVPRLGNWSSDGGTGLGTFLGVGFSSAEASVLGLTRLKSSSGSTTFLTLSASSFLDLSPSAFFESLDQFLKLFFRQYRSFKSQQSFEGILIIENH